MGWVPLILHHTQSDVKSAKTDGYLIDRTQSSRKPRIRAGLSSTPTLPQTPTASGHGASRGSNGLANSAPLSARAIRAARRASLVDLDDGEQSWAALFFRVSQGAPVRAWERGRERGREGWGETEEVELTCSSLNEKRWTDGWHHFGLDI